MNNFLKDNWFKIGILLIILFGVYKYFSFQEKVIADKVSKETFEQAMIQSEKDEMEKKLNSCLLTADIDYGNIFDLNSDPVPGKDGVRRWKSLTLQENADQKLKSDKELCLKRYSY